MMVMGEPGIGKTALCEQLSTYVVLEEEGHLRPLLRRRLVSLPYLAFVEALRS